MSLAGLQFRMWLLIAVLFSIIYGVVVTVGYSLGIVNSWVYLFLSLAMLFIQYMIGPKIIEWSMRVKYVTKSEQPQLYAMVSELAAASKIPMPKVGIADAAIPNAFAFGRWKADGRVCVTRGIMNLLSEDELRAVLAHEVSHLKNKDVLTITLLSVIPLILYRIAISTLYYGGGRRREEGNNAALIGMAAMLFYFITNLLVLYASRIREYFADRGAVSLGCAPKNLASALYKLVYGSARLDNASLKEVEGLKAFFANDPSRALNEIKELRQLDLDKSGTLDASELAALSSKKLNIGFAERLLEIMSTHPNMLKRIKQLSSYSAYKEDKKQARGYERINRS
ncbi:MAG TPA: peptidase [Candidatus Omnitrophica bacterium]|nr:peptidase [Candidatus Omnitrophota bacterium]HBG62745.1 peptidase [Candidatus Omnitrophota bacterium]HCD39087.1 peptidase [Candidatus Omnitrophota bacterium]